MKRSQSRNITGQFLALTGPGCLSAMREEFKELGVPATVHDGGLLLESTWEHAYKINLKSRISSRVLFIVGQFEARNGEELYEKISGIDFTQWIDPQQTLVVEASTKDSEMKDQRYIALKTKDAIVDQFRDKFRIRPSVADKGADLHVWVRVHQDQVLVALNTSGDALFKRGYRVGQVPAPVKEHVAAALLRISGWDAQSTLVDPMCGSGTFLIEGAMMALHVSPGTLRRGFAFKKWKNFDKVLWQSLVESLVETDPSDIGFKVYGSDVNSKALDACRKNCEAAGVESLVELRRAQVSLLTPPTETGMIIVNPPYGERLDKDPELLKDTYRDLGFALKKFPRWKAWVFSPNMEMIRLIGLKPSAHHKIYNGQLQCHFLKYEINQR